MFTLFSIFNKRSHSLPIDYTAELENSYLDHCDIIFLRVHLTSARTLEMCLGFLSKLSYKLWMKVNGGFGIQRRITSCPCNWPGRDEPLHVYIILSRFPAVLLSYSLFLLYISLLNKILLIIKEHFVHVAIIIYTINRYNTVKLCRYYV